MSDHDRMCFYRWLAIAASGGGWLSDYDTIQLHYNPTVSKCSISHVVIFPRLFQIITSVTQSIIVSIAQSHIVAHDRLLFNRLSFDQFNYVLHDPIWDTFILCLFFQLSLFDRFAYNL